MRALSLSYFEGNNNILIFLNQTWKSFAQVCSMKLHVPFVGFQ